MEMYRLTGEPEYASYYLRQLDWIVRRQIDWASGEWHREISPNGRAWGPKADPMKCCYHNGRAILRCLDAISL
jgi:mannobiose 2-epimerase